jgi:2,5-diketo-D-gluconate reductase A
MGVEPGRQVPKVELAGGSAIPQLGFGVFQVPPEETERIVAMGLEAGYRSVDTAAAYGNESGVGKAVAASGIDRGELFITTKLANTEHGHDKALAAFDASLERLGLDYVDLFLIHWPVPAHGLYVETWEALVELSQSGRVREIGVSNFLPEHLDQIIEATGVVPAVNQIELHPGFTQRELRAVHARRGIATESWSPLGQADGELFANPVLVAAGAAHGKSVAQVILRWHLQIGAIVIPKASSSARLAENFDVFDFELTDAEIAAIEAIPQPGRLGADPATFIVQPGSA